VLTVLLLAVIVLLLIGLVVYDVRRDWRPAIDRYVGHRVVLHIRDNGPSLRGVLLEPGPDVLRLGQAEHLGAQAVVTPLDGVQVIPRGRLDFFQVLASGDAE